MIKYTKEFSWKEHSINLEAFDSWLKENAGSDYCGNSADSKLKLHFSEEPSQEIKDSIDQKFEDMDDSEHEFCVSYKSSSEILEENEAKKASGKAKLISLGLTEAEVNSLLG